LVTVLIFPTKCGCVLFNCYQLHVATRKNVQIKENVFVPCCNSNLFFGESLLKTFLDQLAKSNLNFIDCRRQPYNNEANSKKKALGFTVIQGDYTESKESVCILYDPFF